MIENGYVAQVEKELLFVNVETNRKLITDGIVESLIRERKRVGYTQQDIADITGMKAPNVTRIESRKYSPSLDVLIRYANALGKSIQFELVDVDDALKK